MLSKLCFISYPHQIDRKRTHCIILKPKNLDQHFINFIIQTLKEKKKCHQT